MCCDLQVCVLFSIYYTVLKSLALSSKEGDDCFTPRASVWPLAAVCSADAHIAHDPTGRVDASLEFRTCLYLFHVRQKI